MDKLLAAKDEEIDRLDKERLEWKEIALESLGTLRGTNSTLDSVVQGQVALRGLLEAIRDRAGAS